MKFFKRFLFSSFWIKFHYSSLPVLANVFAPAGRLWRRLLWCSYSFDLLFRGDSSSSERWVSYPYDFIEMFWIIHELQMPLCGHIKMPLRPHGISHSHIWEDSKGREMIIFLDMNFFCPPSAPASSYGSGFGLSVIASYPASVLCLIPLFLLSFHVMQSSKLLRLLTAKALVQSLNFPLDYAFDWVRPLYPRSERPLWLRTSTISKTSTVIKGST